VAFAGIRVIGGIVVTVVVGIVEIIVVSVGVGVVGSVVTVAGSEGVGSIVVIPGVGVADGMMIFVIHPIKSGIITG